MAAVHRVCRPVLRLESFVKIRSPAPCTWSWRCYAGAFTIRNSSADSKPAVKLDKQLLTKLRKETGFGFSKCHKALTLHNNDYGLAEAWLHEQAQKEGWAKATKLQGRTAAEGLIGVLVKDNFAAMVEVNCETDFVARNEIFHNLVANITNMALNRRKSILEQSLKLNAFGEENIVHLRETMPEHKLRNSKLCEESNETVADAVARVIGKLGENVKIGRAITMTTEKDSVTGCYVHGPFTASVVNCMMGKFGTVVTVKSTNQESRGSGLTDLAKKLSQHVTGMNPRVVSAGVGSDIVTADREMTDVLVDQEYLMDSRLTVGELLEREGAKVVDFVRFECGGSD